MSLLPLMFSNWWENLEHPHHVPAQHFAMELRPDRMGFPMTSQTHLYNHPLHRFRGYYHPRSSAVQGEPGMSVVEPDKNKFHVTLDTQQFAPNEIKVKVIDNYVVVEGKHDEKQDEHGSITRQFIRKYLVPEQCDVNNVTSSLSSDGVLILNAPRKHQLATHEKERIINIEHTGRPAMIVAEAGKTPMEDKKSLETKKIPQEDTAEEKKVLDESMKNGADEAK